MQKEVSQQLQVCYSGFLCCCQTVARDSYKWVSYKKVWLSVVGGEWWWIYFGWWWVVAGGGGYILARGGWWWIYFGWWQVVVDGGGGWHSAITQYCFS